MSGNRGRGESRNVQAFKALLIDDDHEDSVARPGRRRLSSKGQSSSKVQKGSGRPIMLREELQGQSAVPSTAEASLQDLQAMFASLPKEVIEDVYRACGSSMEAAAGALLELAGGVENAVGGGSSGGGERAVTAPSPGEEHEGPCWGWLPEEVKQLVLAQLTVRDLARAAGACWELAQHVREQRRRMRTVALPEGISMPAVRGAVMAFSHATAVSLSRWAPILKFPNQFEDLFGAIAQGEANRSSGVPIRRIDLSRCAGLTDSDVAVLCSTLRHLDSIDLSRCTQISDGCLGALVRYVPEPHPGRSSEAAELAQDFAALAWSDDADLSTQSSAGLATEGSSGGAQSGGVEEARPGATDLGAEGGSGSGGLESPRTAVQRIAAAKEAGRQAAQQAAREGADAPSSAPAGLQVLRLRETGVTWGGAKALLQGGMPSASSLEVLDVSRCRGVGPQGFGLGSKCMLRELLAAGCLRLRSVVVQLPPSAQLEGVNLSGCRQLQEVMISAGSLRWLQLSHCGVLAALSLKCRSLEELRCINCTRLPGLGPDFDCPALRLCDLFGCRALEAEGLEVAAPSFEALERLNLGGCTLLSRLLLAEVAPRLTHLDISGCGALRQVVLGSRGVRELAAKGCARLLELRLHSVAMEVLDLENCSLLREVMLPVQAPALRAGAHPDTQEGDRRQEQPILKGCAALAPSAKKQLKAAMQGGS